MTKDLDHAVAVIGVAGRFPGARNVEELWRNLRDGVDAVCFFPPEELRALGVSPALIADPTYVPAAAQPPDLDRFDAGFFGINHREAEILDPQQRVFLETCWEALEDAGYDPDDLTGTVTGVFAGQTTSTYLIFNLIPSLMGTMDPLQLLVGNAGDSLATRVSYKLDLKGPSFTVQSACSSSAVAVHTACQSLLNGECDLALAGGVSINVHLLHGYKASEGSVFAKSGRCRAFDAGAEGILFGGGAGVVVLKRAEEALRDGDNVQALILGSAVNNDGSMKVGYTAPSVDGQAEVISEAWAAAGVEMETASYIEAHGTGTRLGDPIEIQALAKAFPRGLSIPIGSVKTNIGHLDVAAGIAGLIKTILALKHREIPPSLHFEEPNPEIDFASSPVYVNTELRPWEGSPRRAGVSSFGFGGTNVHLVLEEAPQMVTTPSRQDRHRLQVSVRTGEALEIACQRLADHLESHPELDLADVEYTLRVGRRTFEHRRVVECRTREEAIARLRRALTPGPSPNRTPGPPGEGSEVLLGFSPPLPVGGECGWERGSGGEGRRRRRVSLPAYPFERHRYWIDPPGVTVPEAAAEPSTFHPRPSLFTPYEPPRDEREGQVCRIWQEVLGVEPVGVHDDFFQLGGHSLLATQILTRVRDAFAVDFPLAHLFSFPTAAELAEAIGFLQQEAAPERIPRAPRPEGNRCEPLSYAQQRMWFLESLLPGTAAFNVPASVHLQGRLDRAALGAALGALVRRHETLRTRFMQVEGRPAQEILAEAAMPLPWVDLDGLPVPARAAEEERLVRQIAWRPFRLEEAPLFRGALLRLGGEEHRLVLVIHHIVADGWSLGVLQRELATFYRGEAPPELPIQYADYAVWQRERIAAGVFDEQIARWRERLAGVPFLELRGDRPRPPVQTFRGGNAEVRLMPDLARSLAGLAGRLGASPFMALLAGFAALLQRYTGQDDFAVGTFVANRNRSETERLVGAFLNNLALRTDLSGEPGFGELLGRVRETTLDAYDRQDLPFEKLLEELRPKRDLSRPPVFQVALNLLNFPAVREELPGISLTGTGLRGERAHFDLMVWMSEEADGSLAGWIEFNTDLFDDLTLERMAGHLERLLAGAAADPDRRARDLPLLGETEREEVLEAWNQTFRSRPAGTFLDLFASQVERAPEAVAAFCEGESLTYRELDRRARSWAGVLAGRGVGPESLVAILSERSLDFLTGVLAVFRTGGADLPLDPHQPAARALAVLRQSGARWLLSGNGLGPKLGTLGVEIDLLEMEELADGESPAARRVDPDNLAYVLYTSGSTGLPKGAMIHHRGMLNHLLAKAEELELTAGDAVAQNASQSFDISVWQLLVALAMGGRVHIYPDEVAHDPAALLAAVERDGVTVLEVVPSMLAAMLDVAFRPRLPRLRWLIPTGEALPPELCRRWLAIHPEIPLLNAYGPTECSDDVAHHPIRQAPGPQVVHTPIGRPVANTRLYIVDRELRPLPAGVAGELCAGGQGVGRGYLGDPLRTAQTFVPDPFAGEGQRLYRTGDLARRLSTGEIEFLGRVDFQVKVRGFRIEPGEVESVLGRHAGVDQAVVVALEERGEKRLVAYVVGEGLDAAGLRAFARERLPDYMVPAAFVVLPEMPLTPNGKVDRRALPAPAWETGGFVAPSTPMEAVLVDRLWPETLSIDRIGARDNFFELGGHSLTATRLTSRVVTELGLQVPLRWIFESPVLADYAARLDTLERRAAAPPLRRVPRGAQLPLSFAQERLWFLDRLEPGSTAYNIPAALRLSGALDPTVLARCLTEIVRRHGALRTTFHEEGGGPVQVVDPPAALALSVEDLRALPPEVREAAAAHAVREEVDTPFDLGRGPLIRARLLRLAEEEWLLVLTVHHIVSDGWSTGVLVRESAALYEAFSRGQPSPLAELPVQYLDFALWQREWLRGEALESQLHWWREELAGAPALLELPSDRARPPVQSYRGASVAAVLPADLTQGLVELGRRAGATLYMTLLAGFQAVLHRYTGQDDVLVGSPVAGRVRSELEGLIGLFVNTLVLRGRTSPGKTFRELLAGAQEASLGAFAHQDLPFEKLVEDLGVERSLAHSPLFQVMLVLQNAPLEAVSLAGVEARLAELPVTASKLDLTLDLTEVEGGLAGSLVYATDLFEAETAGRLLDHLRTLLEGAVADPDARLSDLPLLTEAERNQLLGCWNGASEAVPEWPVHRLFEQQAERTPDKVAAVCGREALTYAELSRRAEALAAHLRRLGVGPEVRVGLATDRSPALLVGVLGTLKAGGAYVPLDVSHPRERLAMILEDARPQVVVTQEALLDALPEHDARTLLLERVGRKREGSSLSTPDNLAYVLFTSGSTGRPKGVQIAHRSLVSFLLSMRKEPGLSARDTLLAVTTLSFDIAGLELLLPLLVGGRVVVASREEASDAMALAGLLVRHEVTAMQATPATWRLLLDSGWPGKTDLKALCGGEALPGELAARLAPRVAELWNLYGPTETTVWSATGRIEQADVAAASLPLGRPIANTRLYLLDPQQEPVPLGAHGELCIGGMGLARGYLGRPDLTAERFVPDPFSGMPGARMYRTGDLARGRATGEIDFLGRLDHQVKIRGFRIELGEIEAALVRHPEVRKAVVLARGEGAEKSLVGYVVPPVSTDLRSFLRESLPEHMVPAGFVFLDAMPLTPNGKVDRKALARIEPECREASSRAARTPAEEILAGIWCDLLGVEQVGVEDGFFDLGGHSLLGTRVMARVRDAFGVELPLRALFESPTLAGLAARVEAERIGGIQAPPIRPVPRTDNLPLSFSQERLWFLEQLEPGGSVYNLPVALHLDGALDVAALAASFRGVVRRHEALRTTFPAPAGRPVQRISPSSDLPLPVVDLASLPAPVWEPELRRLIAGEAARPFDLVEGPVIRALLIRLAEREHACLVTLHHIAGDAWSLGVLVRDVSALYAGAPLPALPVQYADYAVWQRELLRGEALEAQLSWWRETLAGTPDLLELPADRPRPFVRTSRGGVRRRALPAPLTAALQALARREGATLFMTLLAVFQTLLHRISGQEDLLVGTPVAGRSRTELEGLVGFFVNSLVLRGRPSARLGFRDLLAQARAAALGAFDHQDLPFDKLVEDLGVGRSLAHHPLFQVLIALQNVPAGGPGIPDLTIEALDSASATAKFDLTLFLTETAGGGLDASLEYSADLFDGATAQRLLEHFQTLLEGIAADARRTVSELPLLTAGEIAQLLVEWNDVGSAYPAGVSVHELFAGQVERTPDAVAAVFGSEICTYRQLDERANQLAHHLQELGAGPGVPVAIYLERSLDMIVATLAVLKAGSAYVPLDTSYPEERLAFMLEDAGAPVLVTRERWLGLFPGTGVRPVCFDRDRGRLARQSRRAPLSWATSGSLAYVIYTSGSTGRPKGVAVPHRAIVRLVRDTNYIAIRPDDVIAQASNTSFDAATFEIWGALLNGARLVGVTKETMLSPGELASQIRRDGITTLFLTTALFNQVVRERPDAFQPLRTLLFGGEAVDPATVRLCLRCGPPERLLHVYGPTESTTYASWQRVADVPEGATTVPIGQPLGNTSLVVLDRELEPVPVGVIGELYVGGEGLAWGYLNRPELTAERFVPAAGGQRLYRTGDLVRRRADGPVEFLGRADFQVKLRGFRIELGEVEAALVSHPGVRDAAVLVLGEGNDRRLVAYVAVAQPALGAADLRAALTGRLPEFMIPSGWVMLDALPLNPNGKVDRRALARLEPVLLESEGLTGDGAAPRTPTEEVLAGIWADLLGRERVGVREDFFEIGGHSLLGTRLVSRIRQVFGTDLPLRTLFEAPTVEELAARIEETGRGTAFPPLAPYPRDGAPPLSFAQERLWFLDRLAPGSAVYNIPSALRVAGDLDAGTLRRSLAELVCRHETLRTTFAEVAGSPVQVIAPETPAVTVPLMAIDLLGLPEERREAEVRRLAQEEARRPFDLARGPLFRAALLRTGEREHTVVLTLHHILGDGWSMGVLVRELGALYDGSPLPELPVQYADFALWQREHLRGEELADRTDWWREELAGAPAVLELPADRPRPSVQSFRGATVAFDIPSGGLFRLARREGATPFMVLLAALQALLGRLTGQEDVLVGSPVAGRGQVELEGLVGLFVNTLVLRGRLAGGPTFQELLARTRASALGAYAHQELPFERLVDELGVERSLSHNPLFQVLFALQNAPLGELVLPGLTFSPLGLDSATARVDLALSLWDSAGGFAGTAEYSTDLFDPTTALRLLGHLRSLLEGALAHPEAQLSDLPFFGEAERHQLDREWNDTEVEEDGTPVHQLFEKQAQRTPGAVAVVFQGESLTYAELDRRAEALACRLRSLGAGPEARVGLAVERSLDLAVAVLGIWKSGAAYVPLDPSLPHERLAFQIEDAGLTAVVTQELLESAAERSHSPLSRGSGSAAGRGAGGEGLGGEGLAYLIYTSGTTGRPKAVLVEHRHLAHTLAACRRAFSFRAGDRMPCIAPFSFDIFLFELLNPLLAGGTVEIFPLRPTLEVERLVSSLAEATHFHAVPALMRQVVESARTSGPFPRLRELFVGGDAVPAELLADMAEVFPSARTFVLYGPTEASIICSWHGGGSRPLLGRPLPGSVLRLVDADGGEVPIGVSGEIWIGGGGVSRGYLHQPELTAEKFVPGESGTRWYRTGDLARRLPDGTLEFLGRIDHQVKVRGFRIELGEIESRLAAHPAVREAVVLARGEGVERRLVAYIVCETPIPSEALLEPLRAALPDYMIPSAWVFLDALPLSSNGKVDRRALAQLDVETGIEGERVEPRDVLELELAYLWSEVLGAPGMGVRDDFFALGGHSLLAVQLMARVRQRFGRDLPLAALFQGATVESMAALLRDGAPATASCLVPIQPSGSEPPLFLVHPAGGDVLCFAGLARHLGPEQPVYGLQSRGLAGALSGDEQPLGRIEDMAALYVREILRVQPEGPYRLGGWSLGGLIAFEMARQLHAAGEEVALLALLDASPEIAGRGEDLDSDAGFLADMAAYVENLWERRLDLVREDLEGLAPEEQRKLLVERLHEADFLPPGAGLEQVERVLAVYKANARAAGLYEPRPYAGPVTLFQAAEGSEAHDTAAGWERLTAGPVEVVAVPGHHLNLLAEPHVRTLAELLALSLQEARQESAARQVGAGRVEAPSPA